MAASETRPREAIQFAFRRVDRTSMLGSRDEPDAANVVGGSVGGKCVHRGVGAWEILRLSERLPLSRTQAHPQICL